MNANPNDPNLATPENDLQAVLLTHLGNACADDIKSLMAQYLEVCSTYTGDGADQRTKVQAQQLVANIETTRRSAAIAAEVIKLTFRPDNEVVKFG